MQLNVANFREQVVSKAKKLAEDKQKELERLENDRLEKRKLSCKILEDIYNQVKCAEGLTLYTNTRLSFSLNLTALTLSCNSGNVISISQEELVYLSAKGVRSTYALYDEAVPIVVSQLVEDLSPLVRLPK